MASFHYFTANWVHTLLTVWLMFLYWIYFKLICKIK
jgi:hypothetical protein